LNIIKNKTGLNIQNFQDAFILYLFMTYKNWLCKLHNLFLFNCILNEDMVKYSLWNTKLHKQGGILWQL
jgi:hypothetical protein